MARAPGVVTEGVGEAADNEGEWAVTFIPMPMPNRVCGTFFGKGMGMNITAQ